MQANAASANVSSKELAEQLLAFWAQLMRGGGATSLWSLFEELGLTLTQVKALQTLAGCDREVSVKGLAEKLSMSLPNASRTAEALLKRGYVERRENPDDRRSKNIVITSTGADVVRRVESARLQNMESWTETLPPEQRAALHDAIAPLLLPKDTA